VTTNPLETLQERLDKYKASFESGAPPFNTPRHIIEIFHRGMEELRQSGLQDRALKVGGRAPSFELPNQDDIAVRSSELLARGPLVITFFRGHW
jgi:hypothetical protein